MVHAIIQARMGSTRLPGKVLEVISGHPLLWHVFARVKPSQYIEKAILATTTSKQDDVLAHWAEQNNIAYYRGHEDDVLSRYYNAAKKFGGKIIVRITADDPFKDFRLIDAVIRKITAEGLDYVANNMPPSFPEGMDCEAMTFAALHKSFENATSQDEREHVTLYIRRHPELFRLGNISNTENLSRLRWTIDTKEDLEMTRAIYTKLYDPHYIFSMRDILRTVSDSPEIININRDIKQSLLYRKGQA